MRRYIQTISFILLTAFFIPFPVFSQSSSPLVDEEEAMAIDISIAEDAGFEPVEFHGEQIFITPSGIQYNIEMAAVTSSEGATGGTLSGYAWVHKLSETEQMVLTDSLPNTCISIFDLNDYSQEGYQDAADAHWEDCGYFSIPVPTIARNTLQVHPNPAKDGFYLTADIAMERLIILDLTGRNVYTQKLSSKTGNSPYIQPGLNAGTYIIKVYDTQGNTASTKIALQ